MVMVNEATRPHRAHGLATIMAIGTATPPNCVDQTTYPDYYFRVTNCEQMTEVKHKFKRICDKVMIKKRYMHLTEDILKENPELCGFMTPSLDVRQDILLKEVPKLGKEAATKAIEKWGQTKSKITHLIFCTTSGMDMPGADYQLIKLLGLDSSIKRYMLYNHGCYGGGTALRLAKDLAENNKDARILIVCSEITLCFFLGPDESHSDNLVVQALFGDSAAAVIVGAEPIPGLENPMFELVTASQTIVPDSERSLMTHVREAGLTVHLSKDVPRLVAENIEKSLVEAFKPLGIDIPDWNSIFWAMHPGGTGILRQVETMLGLKPEKLSATRHVLEEYGNMSSSSVLFILDEITKKSADDGLKTTGDGLDWGLVIGLGPVLQLRPWSSTVSPLFEISRLPFLIWYGKGS